LIERSEHIEITERVLEEHNEMHISNGFVLLNAKNPNFVLDINPDLYTQLTISKIELNCFDGLIIPLWRPKRMGDDGYIDIDSIDY
jgi:hypothetical protein